GPRGMRRGAGTSAGGEESRVDNGGIVTPIGRQHISQVEPGAVVAPYADVIIVAHQEVRFAGDGVLHGRRAGRPSGTVVDHVAGGDIYQAGVLGIHDDLGNRQANERVGSAGAGEERPGAAAVGGLVDAGAAERIGGAVGLAGAEVDDREEAL